MKYGKNMAPPTITILRLREKKWHFFPHYSKTKTLVSFKCSKVCVNWMYDSYDPTAICFLNLHECIAKPKQQDWEPFNSKKKNGMENDDDEDELLKNIKQAVNYVQSVAPCKNMASKAIKAKKKM